MKSAWYSPTRPFLAQRLVRSLLVSVLAGTLLVTATGCAGDDPLIGPSTGGSVQARTAVPSPATDQVTTVAAPAQGAVDEPEMRPHWLPAAVPVPDAAQLTSVHDATCTVTWVLSGADLQATAAELEARAESSGLDAALSGSSERAVPSPETLDLSAGEELVPVLPATVELLGLRLRGPGVEVDLQMTAIAGGVLIGEHRLSAGSCAR